MRNLKIMSAFVFLFTSLFFISCEKEPNELMQTNQKQDVVFGINHVLPDVLKSSEFDVECSDQEPVTAEIVIDGVTYNPNVFELDGELLTQAIKLNSGNYTVESFMLLDSNGDVVMATPAEGSDFAVYVDQTVTFDIITSEFDKTEVSIDVLCFNEAEYTSFGFNWFNVGQVEVFEIPFFGDLCYDPTSYEGSLYDQVFNLEDYPFDIPAIFEIRTFVDDNGQWESLKTFGNVVNGVLTTGPVMAEYFTHSDGAVDFKFELWIYVQTDVNTWDYVQFDEWTFNSNNPLEATSNGVVDFVVGDCLYDGTPAQYIYDPFELPEQFQGPIIIEGTEPCKEKMAQARWRNFKTNNNGWDMASGSELMGNSSTFTDLDWTSGYLLDSTPMPVTLSYDGNDLTITVDINGVVRTATHTVGSLSDSDIMEIMVRGSANQSVQLSNPQLDGVTLTGVDAIQTGSTAFWTIVGVDYGQPWTLTGDLIIEGEATSQEGAKVDVTIAEVVPCQ